MAPKEELAPPVAIETEPVVHNKPTKDDERVATIEFSRDPRRSKGAITVNSGSAGTSLTIVTSRTEEKPAILSPPSIVYVLPVLQISYDLVLVLYMYILALLVMFSNLEL